MTPLNLNVNLTANPYLDTMRATLPVTTTMVLTATYPPPPPCSCSYTMTMSGTRVVDSVRHPSFSCPQHSGMS